MNELIQQISSRTGISQQQAETAVRMVVEHLKGHLPGPVASQIENLVGGQGAGGAGGGALGDIGKKLGL